MGDHQKLHAFRLGRFPALIALAGVCKCPAGLPAVSSPDPQDNAASTLSRSFRRPEQIPSNEEKQTALREFMQAYGKAFPNNTVGDLRTFRYRLLVTHSCTQTLDFMLGNVSPTSEMLRAEDRDFGPKTQEFNSSTNVWAVRFTKDGAPTALSEEDLIFNFYGWNPATSPEAVAKAFVLPRENLRILGSFEAPDDITKARAYFVISETLYQGKTYGYVNISKIHFRRNRRLHGHFRKGG
jgi:hypothetical protein